MKKSIAKIRIKALKPFFVFRSEFNRLKTSANFFHRSVVDNYQSFYSDTRKKFDTLFNDNRNINDRLDYHRYLIRKMSIIFSSLIVLLSVSIFLISI